MSIEQRKLLMVVDDIAGIVDVERDGCRLARVAIHPCVDTKCRSVGSRRAGAEHSPGATGSAGLGTQIATSIRQPSAGQLECGIGPQMIEVVGVLIAAADREHARAEHIDEAVHDPSRVAPIREHPGQLVGQAETPLGHREKHHAPVRGQPTAVEGSCDFLGVNGWKREWQNRIVRSWRAWRSRLMAMGLASATESYAPSALYTTLASFSRAVS
jgi:hypothetical protein